MKSLKFLIVAVLLGLVGNELRAQNSWEGVISPASMQTNATLVVNDDQIDIANPSLGWKSSHIPSNHNLFSSTGSVKLQVKKGVKLDISSRLEYRFNLQVEYVGATANIADKVTENISLDIEYDPAGGTTYKDIAMKMYQDVHWMKVSITSIQNLVNTSTVTDVEDLFTLRGIIETDRREVFDPSGNIAACSPSPCNFVTVGAATVQFDLTAFDGAEYYDIEWTWIDPYKVDQYDVPYVAGLGDVEFSFDQNSSRVRIGANRSSYTISNTFRTGYIAFRYRAWGRETVSSTNYVSTEWFPKNQASTVVGSTYPSAYIETISAANAHELDKNWQFVTTFAEDGKRKEVISYFDGLNKGRQAITQLPSDGTTIVGQTIYDHEGRPAIQVLPAPIENKDNLNYEPNVNPAPGGTQYGANNFDGKTSPDAMATDITSNGASRYYSPENGFSHSHRDYIPDAKGYPFSQTVYSQDQTGRVIAQSGVGQQHTIGSGHETQYLYSEPDYYDLTSLFGSEIGEASHYKETITIDPNGQMSVSYIDQHGRVIATSLAGGSNPDLNIDDLALDPNMPTTSTIPLHRANNMRIEGAQPISYELNYTYNAKKDNMTHTFWYQFQPEDYVLSCNSICFDCHYDLEVKIIDEEGTVVHTKNTSFGPSVHDANCAPNDPQYLWDGAGNEFSVQLARGTYYIYKKLSVNTDYVDTYWDLYKASADCLNDYDHFYDIAYNDLGDCDVDDPVESTSLCDQFYHRMVMDLSPDGQYGSTNSNSAADGSYIDGSFSYSVFNDDEAQNKLDLYRSDFWGANNEATWRKPLRPYKDADGNEPLISDGEGAWKKAHEVSSYQVLVANWSNSFAESLIEYHPEYPQYKMCLLIEPTFTYDQEMLGTKTMAEAKTAGYINASDAYEVVDNDPLFLETTGERGTCAWWEGQDHMWNHSCPSTAWENFYKNGALSLKGALKSKLIDQYTRGQHVDDDGNITYQYYNLESMAAKAQCLQFYGEDPTAARRICESYDETYFDNVGLLGTKATDEQWELYSRLYVARKNDLIIEVIEALTQKMFENKNTGSGFTNSDLSTDLSGATPRFDRKEVFALEDAFGVDVDDNSDNAIDNLENTYTSAYNTHLSASAQSVCQMNEAVWRRKLEMCPNITEAQITTILQHFRTICEGSYDATRMAGGTSLPSDFQPAPSYYTFDEVLEAVLTNDYPTTYCNFEQFSLELPVSGHPFSFPEVTKENDCACDYIERIVTETIEAEVEELKMTSGSCSSHIYQLQDLLNGFITNGYFTIENRADKLGYILLPRDPTTDFFYQSTFPAKLDMDPSEFLEYKISSGPSGYLMINLRNQTKPIAERVNIKLDNWNITGPSNTLGSGTLFSDMKNNPNGGACINCNNFTVKFGTTWHSGQGPKMGSTCTDPKLETVVKTVAREYFSLEGVDLTNGEILNLMLSCENLKNASWFDELDLGNGDPGSPDCITYHFPSATQKIMVRHLNDLIARQELGTQDDERGYNCQAGNPPPPPPYGPPYDYCIDEGYPTYINSLWVSYDPYNNYIWDDVYDISLLPAGSAITSSDYFFACKFWTQCDPVDVPYCQVALGYTKPSAQAVTASDITEITGPYYDYSGDRWLVKLELRSGQTQMMVFETCDVGRSLCLNPNDWWGMNQSACTTGDFEYHSTEKAEFLCDCEVPEFHELLENLRDDGNGNSSLFSLNPTDVSNLNWANNLNQNHLDTYNPSTGDFYYELTGNVTGGLTEMKVKFGDIAGGDYCIMYLDIPEGETYTFDDITSFYGTKLNTDKMDEEALKGASKLNSSSAYYEVLVTVNGIPHDPNNPKKVYLYSTCYLANCVVLSTVDPVIPEALKEELPCPDCVDCKDLARELGNFTAAHPEIGYNHATYPSLLTAYLNTAFGTNNSFSQYTEYIGNCKLATQSLPGYTSCHFSLSLNGGDFPNFEIALNGFANTFKNTHKEFVKYTITQNAGNYDFCFNFDNLSDELAAEAMIGIMQLEYQPGLKAGAAYPSLNTAAYPFPEENKEQGDQHVAWIPSAIASSYVTEVSNLLTSFNAQYGPSVPLSSTAYNYDIAFNNTSTYESYTVITLNYTSVSDGDQHNELLEGFLAIFDKTNEAYIKPGRLYYAYDNARHEGYEICDEIDDQCETCDDIRDVVLDFDRKANISWSEKDYLDKLETVVNTALGGPTYLKREVSDCAECTDRNLYICEELGTEAIHLEKWLNTMAGMGLTTSTSLSAVNDFTTAAFYPNAAANNPNYAPTVSSTGSSLSIEVSDNLQFGLNVVLSSKDGASIPYGNISTLDYLKIDPDGRGNNYHFLITAYNATDGEVYQLEGVVDAFPITACCYFDDLELCYQPQMPSTTWEREDCEDWKKRMASANAKVLYQDYLLEEKEAFARNYEQSCAVAFSPQHEQFEMTAPFVQHHYTLYYYDQAGNLVQTVPPKGVEKLSTAHTDEVMDGTNAHQPPHTLNTFYRYNSLNQTVWQSTPDGGETEYFYDRLGRLIFSQNARQAAMGNVYAYVKHDDLGRTIEAGQAHLSSALVQSNFYSSPSLHESLLANATKEQVTFTKYDATYSASIAAQFGTQGQENLRNRVACRYYQEVYNPGGAYDNATHYSYDIHGNVQTVLQEYPELAALGHAFKRIDYEYDLISGNVNALYYQRDQADQMIHRYSSDEDNRITMVETSRDGQLWDKDAEYNYYLHGPLVREVIGDNEVQGVDYLYTLQGWIKGINAATLESSRDPGGDAGNAVARDAYAFNLHYYEQDYTSIGNTSAIPANSSTDGQYGTNELFNGNISSMTTANRAMLNEGKDVLGQNFQYDQLNRLTASTSFLMNASKRGDNSWNNVYSANKWSTNYEYDANGNLQRTTRRGHKDLPIVMDDLKYHYKPLTNQLIAVEEEAHIASGVSTDVQDAYFSSLDGGVEDIDYGQDHTSPNYEYDALGNLVRDVQEEIEEIEWNLAGKVKAVRRTPSSARAELEFAYTSDGKRYKKTVKKAGNETQWGHQYYVYDAAGNVMAIYGLELDMEDLSSNFQEIGNWVATYNSGGNPAVIELVQAGYAEDAAFLERLIVQLQDHGLEQSIAAHYSLSQLMGWNAALSQSTLAEYDQDPASFDFMLPALINNSSFKADFIDALWAEHAVEILETLLANDPTEGFLNCLGINELNLLINHLYMGMPPTPNFGTPMDAINYLRANHNNHDMALTLQALHGSTSKAALKNCVQNGTLSSAWTHSNLGMYVASMNTFFDAVSSQMDADDLAAWFISDPDPSTGRAHNHLLQGANAYVLMQTIAYNEGEGFIDHGLSALPDFTVLYNQLLPGIDGKSPSYFSYLIKQEMGDVPYAIMIANLVDDLDYVERLKVEDYPIYGSKRIGSRKDPLVLVENKFSASGKQSNGQLQRNAITSSTTAPAPTSFTEYKRTLGEKRYELSNHLGNVLVTVSDRRVLTEDENDPNPANWWWDADITSAQDYYPFGMLMPDRVYTSSSAPKLKSKRKKLVKVLEHSFTTGTDGWVAQGGATISQNNEKLEVHTDQQWEAAAYYYTTEAGKEYNMVLDMDLGDCQELQVEVIAHSPYQIIATYSINSSGKHNFIFTALSNQTRIKVSRKDPTISGAQDFYLNRATLFKLKEKEQLVSQADYRYAFNGYDHSPEIKGVGNSYNFGARVYDSRIAKFLSVDPLFRQYPDYSPFLFAGNSPIYKIDYNGEGEVVVMDKIVIKNNFDTKGWDGPSKDESGWRGVDRVFQTVYHTEIFYDDDGNKMYTQTTTWTTIVRIDQEGNASAPELTKGPIKIVPACVSQSTSYCDQVESPYDEPTETISLEETTKEFQDKVLEIQSFKQGNGGMSPLQQEALDNKETNETESLINTGLGAGGTIIGVLTTTGVVVGTVLNPVAFTIGVSTMVYGYVAMGTPLPEDADDITHESVIRSSTETVDYDDYEPIDWEDINIK